MTAVDQRTAVTSVLVYLFRSRRLANRADLIQIIRYSLSISPLSDFKMFRVFFSAVVLSLSLIAGQTHAQTDSEFRQWTTNDGKRSGTRLKIIDVGRRGVQLQREDNGKMVTMPLSKLSLEDRDFVKAWKEAPAVGSGGSTGDADWPQWRGSKRDGKSSASGLMSTWPSGGPELLWNVTGLGEGYATPAVVGDTVYVLGTDGEAEFVFALSASDGSQKWKSPMGSKIGAGGFPGPKGTPTIDGDLMYAIGSDGTLVCVRRENGENVWTRNFKRDLGGNHGTWAYAESPLIDGNRLICTPGGSGAVAALNKKTGQPIWQSPVANFTGDDYAKAGYASTIVALIGGTKQYVAFLNGGVVGIAADSGEPLWRYDAPANGTANCSTPVVHNNSVFAASAYGTGGGRADIRRNGRGWNASEAYFIRKMESHHGGFILHDGHVYGTNDTSLLCINWNSGDVVWQDRSVGKGSVSMADGHLYVRGEKGDVALVEATPAGYREKGRFAQPDRSGKQAWAHPVIAGGKLYLHDADRLLCYRLTEK